MESTSNTYDLALEYLSKIKSSLFSLNNVSCFFRLYNEAKKEKIVPPEDNFVEHMDIILFAIKDNVSKDLDAERARGNETKSVVS